jgi:hypothetical protein
MTEKTAGNEMSSDHDLTFAANEEVANLLGCWARPLSTVAKLVGVTKRDIEAYLHNRRGLPISEADSLLGLLRIRMIDDLLIDDGTAAYEPTGPYLFVAHRKKDALQTYDAVSHGGDLRLSYEVVPDRGAADITYRYLLFEAWGSIGSIMMFPRGEPSSKLLDDEEALINYQGVLRARHEFYVSIQETCAVTIMDERCGVEALRAFFRAHDEYLCQFERLF